MHFSVPLMLLAGGFAFTIGFFVGVRISELVFRRRERGIAVDRRRLNAIWRHLGREYGIQKPEWATPARDDG